MNKETRLILENQKEILRALLRTVNINEIRDGLRRQHDKTNMALVEYPTKLEDKTINDKKIYDKVKGEFKLMVLECYDGVGVKIEITSKIMNFVRKAIRKTLIYKNAEITELTENSNPTKRAKEAIKRLRDRA